MVQKRKPKTSKVVAIAKKTIGSSDYDRDKVRKALKPGKRISREGNVYYEKRKNRADVKGGLLKKIFKK